MKIPHVVDHESGCADGTTDALQQYEDIQVCQPIAMTSGARSYDIIMCDRHVTTLTSMCTASQVMLLMPSLVFIFNKINSNNNDSYF